MKKGRIQVSKEDLQKFQGKYIIPVMGATGAGKSTFINQLLGSEVATVGYTLRSCTNDLQAIDVPTELVKTHLPRWSSTHPDEKLVIVDTPGFDDTSADDSDILRRIADWLAMALEVNAKLAGIVYLHEIVADRYSGSRKRNFEVFRQLCGPSNGKSVVLGTTKWGKVSANEIGRMTERQNELQRVFWNALTDQGATVLRVDENADSAWSLVRTVLDQPKNTTIPLRIQAELVLLALSLPQTDAAAVLREEVKKRIESLKRSGASKDELRVFVEEVAKLRPSFGIRFRKWLHFKFAA